MAKITPFARSQPASEKPTRRKVCLERGIYEDNYGRYALVTMIGPDPEQPGAVKKHYKESKPRQPFSTPIETMRAIYRETQDALARQIDRLITPVPPTPILPTLREDVPTFLDGFKGTRKATAANEMSHWIRVFGDRERNSITAHEIRKALVTLEDEYISEATSKPLSAGMVKHLRATFKQFYDVLNSKSGYNPVRDTPSIRVVYDDPRYVPPACVELLLAQISDYRWTTTDGTHGPLNETKLRLQCILYAGLSHAMLARVEARDLQFDQASPKLYLRARRKGKTAKGRTVSVTPQAVEALRLLAANDALGNFSRSSLAKTFALARKKAIAAWKIQYPGIPWPAPANVRAYDFRHTFATDVLLETDGDRGAVMDLLGHGSLEQGERYTQAAASLQSSKAIDKLAAMHARRRREW